jgi:hypothetical protein
VINLNFINARNTLNPQLPKVIVQIAKKQCVCIHLLLRLFPEAMGAGHASSMRQRSLARSEAGKRNVLQIRGLFAPESEQASVEHES